MLHAEVPGVISAAEESTAWPGVSRPDLPRRPGLRLQVEHGLDARHAGLLPAGPALPEVPPPPADVLAHVRLQRELHPPALPRRGRARQGLADRQDAGRRLAEAAPTCARSTPTCGRTPASSCCSWAASSAQEREWSHERSLDWHLLEDPGHAGIQSLVRDLNHAYTDEPALWALDTDPAGFWWLEANDSDRNVVAFCRAERRTANGSSPCVCNLSPVVQDAYRVGLPRSGPLARGGQHRRRRLRRLRRRQPRGRRGRGDALARAAVLGRSSTLPPAGHAVARARGTGPTMSGGPFPRGRRHTGARGLPRARAARRPRGRRGHRRRAESRRRDDRRGPHARACDRTRPPSAASRASPGCPAAAAPTSGRRRAPFGSFAPQALVDPDGLFPLPDGPRRGHGDLPGHLRPRRLAAAGLARAAARGRDRARARRDRHRRPDRRAGGQAARRRPRRGRRARPRAARPRARARRRRDPAPRRRRRPRRADPRRRPAARST